MGPCNFTDIWSTAYRFKERVAPWWGNGNYLTHFVPLQFEDTIAAPKELQLWFTSQNRFKSLIAMGKSHKYHDCWVVLGQLSLLRWSQYISRIIHGHNIPTDPPKSVNETIRNAKRVKHPEIPMSLIFNSKTIHYFAYLG